jgi:hypothetical protein
MTALRRILAVASSTAAMLALAGPARAATLATSPCVRTINSAGKVPITATGFTPGSLVTVQYATKTNLVPSYLTSGTADPAGNFTTTANAPGFNPFSRQLQMFGISAADNLKPAVVATTTYEQVRVGYTTNPATGKPTRNAVHTVRGFPPASTVYLHFRFEGQTKRNVKVGTAKGVCGIASKRMRLLPTRSHPGLWTVYADQQRTFSKTTRPQLKSSFRITRTSAP